MHAASVHRSRRLLCISEDTSASMTCLNTVSNYTAVSRVRVKDAGSQMMTRRNVAKMLIAVVVMFGVCFLPVHLLNILRSSKLLCHFTAPRFVCNCV